MSIDTLTKEELKKFIDVFVKNNDRLDPEIIGVLYAALDKAIKPSESVKITPQADFRCKAAHSEDQIKMFDNVLKVFNVLTKVAEEPPSFSYRGEDALKINLLDRLLYWKKQTFFPEGKRGDVSSDNGLFRVNWFNGRFLTAEALRRQDAYWDIRNRLAAQIHPAGIAWGMGVRLQPGPSGVREKPIRQPSKEVVLEPGLAFDPTGSPIVVGKAFRFPFQALLDNYRRQPRRVEKARTNFLPCVCLEISDPIDPGAGPGILEGPYLLVIEPEERLEGEAKVYGELCENQNTIHCQADGWRGGFGLSLARFDGPQPPKYVEDYWHLRGFLSAYYFDVFEHDLSKRWDPPFLRDDGFCRGTGPRDHAAKAVPLAMVYIGHDGSVEFFDPWIPRRTLAVTAAETCHMQTFGAPKPSAAYARIHQFQCQLRENLLKYPLLFTETVKIAGEIQSISEDGGIVRILKDDFEVEPNGKEKESIIDSIIKVGVRIEVHHETTKIADGHITSIDGGGKVKIEINGNNRDELIRSRESELELYVIVTDTFWQLSIRNLYKRGFRHIPPVGFLPVDLKLQYYIDKPQDNNNNLFWMWPFCLVKEQALSYFADTNVFTYFVTALHDDDIFEDIQNAFYKDPITIEHGKVLQFPDACNLMRTGIENLGIFRNFVSRSRAMEAPFMKVDFTPAYPMAMLAQAIAIFMNRFDLDQIVNRHLELVKVIVPLQGIRRRNPMDDSADLNDKLVNEWLEGIDDGNLRNMVEKLLQQQDSIIGSLPRHFAVYVKQRVMLLDTLYLLIELLQQLQFFDAEFMGFMQYRDPDSLKNVDIDTISKNFAKASSDKRAAVQAFLSHPIGQEMIAEVLVSASDELRIRPRLEDFLTTVEETDKSLEPTIPDVDQRRFRAFANTVEDRSLEHPEYALFKPIVAMAPSSLAAESILRRASFKAGFDPALDAHGKPRGHAVDKDLIHPEIFKGWDKYSRSLYAEARKAMAERKISDITTIKNDTPLGTIFRLTKEEAVERLGEADYETLKTSISKETKKLAENIRLISAEPPREKWVERYNKLLDKHKNDEVKALEALTTEFMSNAEANKYLKRFEDMKNLLGDKAEASLARLVFSRI